MTLYSTSDLRILAERYCDATGESLHGLGTRAANNAKMFKRLAAGAGCTAEKAERASAWFAENWPADVAWPEDVARPVDGPAGQKPSGPALPVQPHPSDPERHRPHLAGALESAGVLAGGLPARRAGLLGPRVHPAVPLPSSDAGRE